MVWSVLWSVAAFAVVFLPSPLGDRFVVGFSPRWVVAARKSTRRRRRNSPLPQLLRTSSLHAGTHSSGCRTGSIISAANENSTMRSSSIIIETETADPQASAAAAAAASSPSYCDSPCYPDWTDEFLSLFQGDFDNYRQVVEDRDNGMLPREGGGHEHMHSRLIPLLHDKYSRLAAFYLDAVPRNIFRFRFYKIIPSRRGDGLWKESNCAHIDSENSSLDLQIYFLNQVLEQQLRQSPAEDWTKIFDQALLASNGEIMHTYVPHCDIRWRRCENGGFHATMRAGETGIVIPSQNNPRQLIHIQDELWITPNQLIIHDRGRDPNTKAWIYGNQRGVPYRLDRVRTVCSSSSSSSIHMDDDDDLQWTSIGPSSPLYQAKMQRIGGPTALPQHRMNNSTNHHQT